MFLSLGMTLVVLLGMFWFGFAVCLYRSGEVSLLRRLVNVVFGGSVIR